MRVPAAVAVAGLAAAAVALWLPAVRQRILEHLPPAWHLALSAWRHGVRAEHSVRIVAPDGTTLAASLYRPAGDSGPLPTILIRLPYHRLRYPEGWRSAVFFAKHGYAVVVQDLRGTGDSGGELLPWRDAEGDGIATLDWIAAQPWSTGKVGTFGCSALGETQFALARANHAAHRAMVASGAGGAVGSALGRHGYFGLFEGGVFQLASGFGWFVAHGARDPATPAAARFDLATHLAGLPVSGLVRAVRPGANGYADFLSTPLGDPAWHGWGYLADADRISVPSLVINTWGDQTVGDALAHAASRAASGAPGAAEQKVFIAPGGHCGHERPASESRFGEPAVTGAEQPWQALYLAWFDFWLRGRGEGLRAIRPFNAFMLGENRWISSDRWPPEGARAERWHLGGAGRANGRAGDGTLSTQAPGVAATDRFTYDPRDPVPSRGGPLCCTGDPRERSGPADQSDVETRRDVLVYTSAPLDRDLRIAGPIRAALSFSSSAPDTDLVARLAHVRPDGLSTDIQEGALRLRYRDGFAAPSMMEPGRRYAVMVDMRATAYRIPRGHRLRLHVTSSSFPRLERNLNTGAPANADETRSRVAENAVHHGGGAPSWVEFPVLPGESAGR